jgi:hypothetical protein
MPSEEGAWDAWDEVARLCEELERLRRYRGIEIWERQQIRRLISECQMSFAHAYLGVTGTDLRWDGTYDVLNPPVLLPEPSWVAELRNQGLRRMVEGD